MMKKTLLAVVLTLSSVAHAEDAMIEVSASEGGMREIRAAFTSDVVAALMAQEGAEMEALTDAEARALALQRGIALPEAGDDDQYGRPWFIVKGGIGLPNLVSASVEVFVHRNWTVELGAGGGLLPTIFEGSIRWRPDATCWDCDGDNFLSIGFGIDPGVYVNGAYTPASTVGLMVTATVDIMYIHRFAKHFGLMVGARVGAGIVTEFNEHGSSGIEPAIKVNLLQVGFAF